MSVMCKFFKRIILIVRKNTWNAADWAKTLLKALTDWGIPHVIISDRDHKFISDFWKVSFDILDINFLTSITYHSQTDKQSEQMNQTVKIALCYYLTSNQVGDWSEQLFIIRGTLNNLSSALTSQSSNKILYNFQLRDSLVRLNWELILTDFIKEQEIHRSEVTDVIVFANTDDKLRYDQHHHSIIMKEEDKAFIKLYKDYTLLRIKKLKFVNQRTSFFRIIHWIRNLAYELDISKNWKIHPVILVTQLELALKQADFYSWQEKPEKLPLMTEFNEK